MNFLFSFVCNIPARRRQAPKRVSISGVATEVRRGGGCGPHRTALAMGGKGAKNAENV